ncbi:transcription factor [Halolamina sp. R1-12]|nr:transcription factor [Halolamina sp. R1-12]
MVDLKIANVSGMITYRQELDLAALAETFSEREDVTSVTYEPSQNHWLQTRFPPDNTYVAFYRSGRCSITGCGSIEEFNNKTEQINGVMRDILKFDYKPATEINNIVATTDFGSPIPLELLTLELGMNTAEYEPEQFPALVYRGSDHIILVFASGKLLCTGVTDLDAASEAFANITSQIHTVI